MAAKSKAAYEIFRYDPDRGEVVLVREGKMRKVDPDSLSPALRERFEALVAKYSGGRKSA